MYNKSPNRNLINASPVPVSLNRSRSPIQRPMGNFISPQKMDKSNIIGNLQAPPGMKTVLKPKYFEAVEVPFGSVPSYNSNRSSHQPHQSQVQPYQSQQNQTQQNQSQSQPQMVTSGVDQTKRIFELEKEVHRYKQLIENNSDQQNYIQIIDKLQSEKTTLEKKLNHFQSQMNQIHSQSLEDQNSYIKQLKWELDEQKRLLTNQCEQYYKMFQKSETEKDDLTKKIRRFEGDVQQMNYLSGYIDEQDQKLQSYQEEINKWKIKCNESEEERVMQIEQIKQEYEKIYNQQFENIKVNAEQKCRMLEEEMDRNRNQLNEAIKEAEQWRGKYHQEDLDKLGYTQRISHLELTTLHQQKEIDRLTLGNLQKQQENESLKQRINQLEFNHVQSIQPSLETELRRTKEQIEARNRELDDLRRRNQDLEKYCIKMKEIEVEFDILQKKYNEQEQKYNESQKWKARYEQLSNEESEQKKKIERLENNLSDKKREEYRYQSEIQRLNDLLRLKEEEMSKQNQDFKRSMAQLQSQVNQFKDQYELELNNVQNAKNKSEQEFRENLEKKFQIVKEELENMRQEREQLIQSCQQLSQTKVQLENKIVLLTGEIERLNQVIRTKYDEQQNLKENYRLLNDQLDQSQQLADDYRKELEAWKQRSTYSSQPKSTRQPYESQRQSVPEWN